MGEPDVISCRNSHDHRTSGNAPTGGSTVTAIIDGSVDEPPIPCAGSSNHLTEKSEGETRFNTTHKHRMVESGPQHAVNQAHQLSNTEVARLLQVDTTWVEHDFSQGSNVLTITPAMASLNMNVPLDASLLARTNSKAPATSLGTRFCFAKSRTV